MMLDPGFFPYENVRIMPKVSSIAYELGTDEYSPKVKFSEFAIKSYNNSEFSHEHNIELHNRLHRNLNNKPIIPTLADTITLISLGLGLWWAAGGPIWAGLLSILGDEIDGYVARNTNTASKRGDYLDWGSDVTLTAASLMRLGINTRTGFLPMIIGAPIFLLAQAHLKADNWSPPVGSARSVIMLSTMVIGKR